MQILFVSDTGLPLGLAMRCSQDGHSVRYLSSTSCGQGLVETHDHKEGWVPDMTVLDSTERTSDAESIRSQGFKVLGPSRWSTLLETDPNYQKQIITSLGWSSAPLYGTHFYISSWFNGASFIASYGSIVYRRFMSGGAGPDLTCTGMLGNFKDLPTRTYQTFLKPLERVLKKVNHRGCIHIHAVVNQDKFSVKDINASLIHPLALLLFENTNVTVSDILLRLVDEVSKPVYIIDPWACGMQLSVSPYPHGVLKEDHFIQMDGVVKDNLKHLWLANVSKKKEQYFAHDRGRIGFITARGCDPMECTKRMYRTLNNLKIPDVQFRNDIGKETETLIKSLRQPGWLA